MTDHAPRRKHHHRPKQVSTADELFEYRSVEKQKLNLTVAITGSMMAAEIIGGILTNSLALISDAGHMFTHFLALIISLAAILYANRETSHEKTFGFFRVEILAALFNSVFLFGVTAWILFEGIRRILDPAPVLGPQMFWVAVAGLIVNLVSAVILHGAGKESLNVKSAFLHMLADTVSSVVIVVGAVVISLTGWNIIDPILSIGIALVILAWGWGLFCDSVNILLEATPKGISTDVVSKTLNEALPAIEEITDLHVWEITSKMYSMTVHIRLKPGVDRNGEREIAQTVRHIVDKRFDIEHTTIEFE